MSQECDLCMEKISDHLDQEEELSSQIEAHLESCPQCQEFVEMWSGEDAPLAAMASVPNRVKASDAIEDAVFTRAIASRKRRKILPWYAWGAAAAAIAVIVGVTTLSDREEPKVSDQKPVETQPDVPPNRVNEPRLSLANIDIEPLEEQASRLKKFGAKALRMKGQSYANAVKGLRSLASNF